MDVPGIEVISHLNSSILLNNQRRRMEGIETNASKQSFNKERVETNPIIYHQWIDDHPLMERFKPMEWWLSPNGESS